MEGSLDGHPSRTRVYAVLRGRPRLRPWLWAAIVSISFSALAWPALLLDPSRSDSEQPLVMLALGLFTALPLAFGAFAADRARGRHGFWPAAIVIVLVGCVLPVAVLLWPGNRGAFRLGPVLVFLAALALSAIAISTYALRSSRQVRPAEARVP